MNVQENKMTRASKKYSNVVPVYLGDFANYWQVFVPHPLRFKYHFVSVYYHLEKHYLNFFKFF